MKLKKIVKHIDSFATVRLNNENGEMIWSGSALSLQAAADTRNDKEQYLEECTVDEDYKAINEVLTCEKFLNWKLFTDNNGEALTFGCHINKHGVTIPDLTIDLKEC